MKELISRVSKRTSTMQLGSRLLASNRDYKVGNVIIEVWISFLDVFIEIHRHSCVSSFPILSMQRWIVNG